MNLYLTVETTGIGSFIPPQQRVIHVAWEFEGEIHSYYIKCDSEISTSTRHGITTDMLQNGEYWTSVCDLLLKDISKCSKIISHNVEFVIGSVLYQTKCVDVSKFKKIKNIIKFKLDSRKYVCTMKSTVAFCKIKGLYGNKYPTLDELEMKLFGETSQESKVFHWKRTGMHMLS